MTARIAAALVLTLLLAAGPVRAAEVREVVSPGGIAAWLVEDHSIPLIAVDFTFRGGAALDPEGREGLAEFVSVTLDEGAGEYDSQTFQRTLEDNAIQLGFDAGQDNFSGRLKTLTKNRELAFDLLRLALTAPRFDPDPVGRMRAALLASLGRSLEDPDRIASRAWWSAVFPDHPYGRPVGGTIESLKAISADNLHAFVARRIARDNLVVAVVGDITPEALGPLLDSTFGALPAEASPWDVPLAEPANPGELTLVERDIPQSVVVFGDRGLARDDPDYYAAYVMNHILGGGSFNSRLYEEVREKRGLAYGIYTFLYPLEDAALIMGSVATQNARLAETVAVLREQWDRLAEEGVSEEELAAAKAFLTGSFPLRFGSTDGVAGIVAAMQVQDLGIDYLDRRNALIEAVTVEDVRRVASRMLNSDTLTVTVVGAPDPLPEGAAKRDAG
ncbi:MAG: insulinase family protein [Rhodospirillaceae bacterium]|jgi:zinc protease|nr:insulinase family protein [Rhodospirillaceae bacterium]MBT6117871.1 insulinase family protein [Rhodospirillaceae bacterium]